MVDMPVQNFWNQTGPVWTPVDFHITSLWYWPLLLLIGQHYSITAFFRAWLFVLSEPQGQVFLQNDCTTLAFCSSFLSVRARKCSWNHPELHLVKVTFTTNPCYSQIPSSYWIVASTHLAEHVTLWSVPNFIQNPQNKKLNKTARHWSPTNLIMSFSSEFSIAFFVRLCIQK